MLGLEYLKVYAECVDAVSFRPGSHISDVQKDTVNKIVQSWEENANVTGESDLI